MLSIWILLQENYKGWYLMSILITHSDKIEYCLSTNLVAFYLHSWPLELQTEASLRPLYSLSQKAKMFSKSGHTLCRSVKHRRRKQRWKFTCCFSTASCTKSQLEHFEDQSEDNLPNFTAVWGTENSQQISQKNLVSVCMIIQAWWCKACVAKVMFQEIYWHFYD